MQWSNDLRFETYRLKTNSWYHGSTQSMLGHAPWTYAYQRLGFGSWCSTDALLYWNIFSNMCCFSWCAKKKSFIQIVHRKLKVSMSFLRISCGISIIPLGIWPVDPTFPCCCPTFNETWKNVSTSGLTQQWRWVWELSEPVYGNMRFMLSPRTCSDWFDWLAW